MQIYIYRTNAAICDTNLARKTNKLQFHLIFVYALMPPYFPYAKKYMMEF